MIKYLKYRVLFIKMALVSLLITLMLGSLSIVSKVLAQPRIDSLNIGSEQELERVLSLLAVYDQQKYDQVIKHEVHAAQRLSKIRVSQIQSIGLSTQALKASTNQQAGDELQTLVNISVILGSGPRLQDIANAEQQEHTLAELEQERLIFKMDLASLYTDLWEQHEKLLLVEKVNQDLINRSKMILNAKALPQLDQLDLETYLSKIALLVEAEHVKYEHLYAKSKKYMGKVNEEILSLLSHDQILFQHEHSPWQTLIQHLDQHPILNAHKKKVKALQSQALAVEKSMPWLMQIGGGFTTLNDGHYATGALSISVPIGDSVQVKAEAIRSYAQAEIGRLKLASVQVQNSLNVHHEHWQHLFKRTLAVKDKHLPMLKKREQLTRSALFQQYISLNRWILALEDLLEIQKNNLEQKAHLWTSLIHAKLLQNMMGTKQNNHISESYLPLDSLKNTKNYGH